MVEDLEFFVEGWIEDHAELWEMKFLSLVHSGRMKLSMGEFDMTGIVPANSAILAVFML